MIYYQFYFIKINSYFGTGNPSAITLKFSSTLTSFHLLSSSSPCSCKISLITHLNLARVVQDNITFNNSSYLDAGMRSRPSSKCISLFSRRLFKTGKTFLSAFSIPSRISTRPSVAALTALWSNVKHIWELQTYFTNYCIVH